MDDPKPRVLGVLHTCWPDRWGIPRQAGLVPHSWGELRLATEVPGDALRGLEAFSHVWLVAWLHGVSDTKWTIRPPRLGGMERRGVLATRSPHRPSKIALSAVRLVEVDPLKRRLRVAGHDLLDGTPILDVKPYLPWADAIADASAAPWAARPPRTRPVELTPQARASLAGQPELEALIVATLAADPRQESRDWSEIAVRVEDRDVHARAVGDVLVVHTVRKWEG
jgi:tRNA-Thr(GGU) m(6)t(6)A37 methyltransferase TsaA